MKGFFGSNVQMFISSRYFLMTRYIRPIWGQTIQHWREINWHSFVLWSQYYQVIQIAENVDAEQSRADGQDVEVKLVVGKNAHVPEVSHWPSSILLVRKNVQKCGTWQNIHSTAQGQLYISKTIFQILEIFDKQVEKLKESLWTWDYRL